MTKGLSIWLDALRVLATVVVVLSHWAYPRFTGTDYAYLRDWNVGSDAVIVFFVISGFVIAYAAERDENLGRFTFNRLTRLWSVLIPALILTLIFDRIGYGIDPSAYPAGFYQPLAVPEFIARGLSMSNEWGLFGRLRLGTNGPLWSLSYEAAYYALLAVAMFLRGPLRVGVLILGALLVGLNVLLLMPAWLAGVWLWRKARLGAVARIGRGTAWALAIGGPLAYLAGQGLGVPDSLARDTAALLGVDDVRRVLGFSDEVIWNSLIAAMSVAHIAGVAALWRSEPVGGAWVRWLAGASFSVYVTHYPALHLLDATLPDGPGRHALLLIGSVAVGLIFGQIFERPIGRLRAMLLAIGREPEMKTTQTAPRHLDRGAKST